jgi:acetyl esterase/lipase
MTAQRSAGNMVARALLTASALIIAVFPGVVVLGGYLPDLPTIGRFGVYLTTDLLAVIAASIFALVPVLIALRMGGGRYTRLLGALVLAILGGTLVAGGALAVTASTNGATFDPFRQVVAGPTDVGNPAQRLDIATADGTVLHADLWSGTHAQGLDAGLAPALVFVHGGGFVGGELGMRPWLYRAVNDAGFSVLDIEYRLAPPPRWRDAPGDVLCALAWVREHGTSLGIDIERVVIAGDSAGGSLALVAGYIAGRDPGTVPMGITSSCGGAPVVPAGIVAIEPAADLEGIWQDRTISDGDGSTFPEAYIGGTPSQFPERYDAASPFSLINEDVPPTLIVSGANDHLVRQVRVQSIVDALQQAGAHYPYIVIPFADHGLDGSPNSAGSQLLEGLLPAFVADPAAVIRR